MHSKHNTIRYLCVNSQMLTSVHSNNKSKWYFYCLKYEKFYKGTHVSKWVCILLLGQYLHMNVDRWRNIESGCEGAKVDLVPLPLRKFLSCILSVKNVKCYKVTHVSIQKKRKHNKRKQKTKRKKERKKEKRQKERMKQTNKQTNQNKIKQSVCVLLFDQLYVHTTEDQERIN